MHANRKQTLEGWEKTRLRPHQPDAARALASSTRRCRMSECQAMCEALLKHSCPDHPTKSSFFFLFVSHRHTHRLHIMILPAAASFNRGGCCTVCSPSQSLPCFSFHLYHLKLTIIMSSSSVLLSHTLFFSLFFC